MTQILLLTQKAGALTQGAEALTQNAEVLTRSAGAPTQKEAELYIDSWPWL